MAGKMLLLLGLLAAVSAGKQAGLRNAGFTSLSHWTKNQNAALYWGGSGNVEVLSQQATSTPGIRQDKVPVVKGKIYSLVVVGKCSSTAKLWVENSDGGEVVWDSNAILQKSSTVVTAQFLATNDKVNVGVLFDTPTIGAKMTINRMNLRLATKVEAANLLEQAGQNSNGKIYNANFLSGERGWLKNDKVTFKTLRQGPAGGAFTKGKVIVSATQSDGTPGIRQNAITVRKNEVYTLVVTGHTDTVGLLAQPWVQDAVTGEDLVWAASTPMSFGKHAKVQVTFLAETTTINIGVLMNRPAKGAKMTVSSIHLVSSSTEAKHYIQQEILDHRHGLIFNTDFSHKYGWWPNLNCKLQTASRTLTVKSVQDSSSTPGVRQDGIAVTKGNVYTMTIEGSTNARNVKPWIQDDTTQKDIIWAKAPRLSGKKAALVLDFTPTSNRINVGVLFSGSKKGDTFSLSHFSIRPKGWGCSHVKCRYNRNKNGGYSLKVFHHQMEEYGTHHRCQYNQHTKSCGCECS